MQNTLLASVLIFSICISTLGSSAADEKLSAQQIEALFDQLAITAADTYLQDGQQHVRLATYERIKLAMEQLHQAGEQAWPHWIAHLDDKRPSTLSAQVIGPPPDIGHKCYYAIRYQLIDLPKEFRRSKTSADNQIDFGPSLCVWLENRKAWSLDQMRCDVLAQLIKIETEVNQNPQSAAVLQTHLNTIQRRVAASKGGKSSIK